MIRITDKENNYVHIFDYLLYKDSKPNIACLVILVDIKNNIEIARTTTDKRGFWEFNIQNLEYGKYQIQFYGSNSIKKLKPNGDWEEIEYYSNINEAGENVIDRDGNLVNVPNYKKVIWSAYSLADTSYNSSISGLGNQLFLDNSHSAGYVSKFAVRYIKQKGDKYINLRIYPNFVLDGGLFSSANVFAARFYEVGGDISADTDLAGLRLLTVDLTGFLDESVHDFIFQIKKTGTAVQTAIKIEEVFVTPI